MVAAPTLEVALMEDKETVPACCMLASTAVASSVLACGLVDVALLACGLVGV